MTTQNDIRKEYARERAAHPERPALDCLRAARYNIRMAAAEFPRWIGDDVTMPLPRGERIVMRLECDSDADIADRFGAIIIDRRPDRHAREYGAPDWWQDRDGTFHVMGDWNLDHYTVDLDSHSISRDWYRAHGMARHDAWLRARQDRERAARAYRDAMGEGYVGYIVTLYDAAGDEVEEESCWGFEAGDDYAGQEAYSSAVHMAEERAEYWEREVTAARDRMHAAGVAFTDLAHEYRKARSIGPAVCDAIRARLESLRAEHRAALAVIAGDACLRQHSQAVATIGGAT